MKTTKLFFDFDETIVFRDGMWSATIHKVLKENGHNEIDLESIKPYTQKGYPWSLYEIPHKHLFKDQEWWVFMEKWVEDILLNLNLPKKVSQKLSKLFRPKYLEINYWKLYEDTLPILNELSKNYDCYLLSNHVPELNSLVEQLDLKKYFMKIYNSAEIGYEKPHFKFYQHILNDLNILPTEAIMIGNNYISDITGARSNGIFSILVRSENSHNYKYYSEDLFGIIEIINEIKQTLPNYC